LFEKEDHLREILKGCVERQRSSQKLLYEQFYSYGMSICLRYADTRDDAAAILNDGFMKIFKSISQFDLSKPFKPWFRKVMVNTAINHYHANQRRIEAEEIDKAEKAEQAEKIISGISYQEIIGLLQKLPPAYRTVFNLYVIEGYNHEEIATMLGISAGTSKSNLSKAKEALKKILNDFFEVDYVERTGR
jgi:RNA polymerase sigma factor (sigma-70 family)